MFLFERLFGITIYITLLVFICMLLSKTSAKTKTTLVIYNVCLSAMAFLYKPYTTSDLYRIYEIVDYFGEMDFIYFWNNFALNYSTPVSRLLYWAVGKTGIKELLPALVCFVCYYLIFDIFIKTEKRFNISKKNISIVLFFVMTTSIYTSVIIGIRMMLALSIIAHCFFNYYMTNKIEFIDIMAIFVSIFIHNVAIIFVAVCILPVIVNIIRTSTKKVLFIMPIGIVCFTILAKYVNIFNKVFEKAHEYIFGDQYSDSWEYIMGILILVIIVSFVKKYIDAKDVTEYKVLKPLVNAVIISSFISVAFCFEFSIFYRFIGHFSVVLSIPLLLIILDNNKVFSNSITPGLKIKMLLMFLSALIAVISCTRGSLSSLKFFVL